MFIPEMIFMFILANQESSNMLVKGHAYFCLLHAREWRLAKCLVNLMQRVTLQLGCD